MTSLAATPSVFTGESIQLGGWEAELAHEPEGAMPSIWIAEVANFDIQKCGYKKFVF